jgi:DNA-binding FrmR family transcriptional regulator
MSNDLNTEIKITADAQGVETGVTKAKRSLASLGQAADQVGEQGGKGLEKMGAGGERAAQSMDKATKNMVANLQRQTAALEAGGTANRQYQESIARMRGADLSALKPYLDQLDQARVKAEAATRAQNGMEKGMGGLGSAANFARGQLAALAGSLTLASAFSFVKSINDGVDALNDIKDATGASIENISALEDVGRRTGASFETVGSILVKFNDVLSKATPKSDVANALKAIGLEAEELKRLDPAEALRVTAVALSNYADDANKARLIQDLFGKSVKEAAPFLTDLAEKTELTAKVFTQQAEAAEKFNKELFNMQANVAELSRSFVGPLVEGINATAKAFREGAAAGKGFWEIASRRYWNDVRGVYGMDPVTPESEASDKAAAEAQRLQRLQGQLIGVAAAASREPDNKTAQRRLESLTQQIQAAKKAADEAAIAVINLLAPPVEYTPPVVADKPSVQTPKTQAELNAAAAAAKQAADARKKALEEEAKLLAELSGLSGSFAKEWEVLNTAFANGKLSTEQLAEAQGKLLEKQPFMVAIRKQEAEALKLATDASKDRVDAYRREVDGIDKWLQAQEQASTSTVKGIEDRIASMQQEEDAARLAAATNITLAEAINRVRIARLLEKRDGPTGVYEGSEEYDRQTAEIEALRREADQIGSNDRSQKARDSVKRATDDLGRMVSDISGDLASGIEGALRRGGENGSDALRDSVEEAFRKPIRVVLNGIMNQVTGGVLQMLGIGGGGGVGGAGGGLGTVSNLFTAAQQGYNLYAGEGLISQAWGGVQGALGIGQAGQVAAAGQSAASMVPGVGGGATSGMGALGAAGFWAAVAYAIGNAIGVNRKKELVGTGLTGTLGGADLTPWENFRKPGTVLMGPDYNRVNPLEIYEDYRKRDLEYVKTLKENGGTGTLNGSPYGNDFAATAAMGNSEYLDNIREIAASSKRQSDEVQKGYAAVRKGAVDMANSLGLAGDKLKDFTVALEPEDLNFKDLNAEQISEKIAKVFGDAGKDMAQQVLGTWVTETVDVVNSTLISQLTDTTDQLYDVQVDSVTRTRYVASEYAKAGETAFETLTRLATSFNTLNEASDALGFGIHQGSLALADFADDFIEAFGGLEAFATKTGAFLQAYYTDDERKTYLIDSAVRKADTLGIKGLTAEGIRGSTRGQFRDYVNTAASNPALYKEALDLAIYLDPVFAAFETQAPVVQEVANVVDELTQSYQNAVKSLTSDRDNLAVDLLRAQGDEVGAKALEKSQYMAQFSGLDEVRRREIETLYDANVATRAYIQSIKDTQQARVDALARQRDEAKQSITDAASATDAAWSAFEAASAKQRQDLETTKADLQQIFNAAKDGAKSLFAEVDDVVRMQGTQGREFIAQALQDALSGGKLPDGEDLADAIAAVGRDFSTGTFSSQAEADYQRLVVANQLKGLQDVGEDQLTETEKQLKKLDEDLEQGREMIAELRGINLGAKDMATALTNLVTAYNTESQTRSNVAAQGIVSKRGGYFDYATGTGLTSSGTFFDADAIKQIAIDSGATGEQIYKAVKAAGFTIAEAEKMFGSAPGSLEEEARKMGLAVFHEGINRVPRTGLALLQEGEAVIPAMRNPFSGDPSLVGNGRLERLMAAQTERVDAVAVAVERVAASTLRTAQVLESVKRGDAIAIAEPTEF